MRRWWFLALPAADVQTAFTGTRFEGEAEGR